MTAPANVRVNIGAPFPSLVKASGPVTVAKSNGIWTLGFSMASLGVRIPSAGDYATDYVLVYDSILGTLFNLPLANLPASPRTQRSVTSSGALPIATSDQIVNVNVTSGGFVVSIPAASGRSGSPLTFKNVSGGSAFTISAAGSDTFDGQANLLVPGGAVVTLTPYNDGINNSRGYAVG